MLSKKATITIICMLLDKHEVGHDCLYKPMCDLLKPLLEREIRTELVKQHAQEEIQDDKTQMCFHCLASTAPVTLNPSLLFQTTMCFWKIYAMEKNKCYGYGDGRLRVPGGGSDSRSVEMVGCCLFSNSRSLSACFLQIMLHKQA